LGEKGVVGPVCKWGERALKKPLGVGTVNQKERGEENYNYGPRASIIRWAREKRSPRPKERQTPCHDKRERVGPGGAESLGGFRLDITNRGGGKLFVPVGDK